MKGLAFWGVAWLLLCGACLAWFLEFPTRGVRTYDCPDCNVILISLDTLRADHLSCYGYPRRTSPNLDRLSENSALFLHAFSQEDFTLPSHMSIFTSMYPSSHRVRVPFRDSLSKKILTLPQILKLYGYYNVWVGPLHDYHLPLDKGFGRGFDQFFEEEGMEHTWRNAFSWLRGHSHGKFFLFLHTYYVHSPYLVQDSDFLKKIYSKTYHGDIPATQDELARKMLKLIPRYYNASPRLVLDTFGKKILERYPELLNGEISPQAMEFLISPYEELNGSQMLDFSALERSIYMDSLNRGSEEDEAYLSALYDTKIHEMDGYVGRLISLLRQKHFMKKTIIAITGDHGEELLEHGYFDHGISLFNEEIHVPLLFYLPGGQPGRFSSLAESIDIMPTILDALKIPIPEQAQGISQLPRILGYPTPPTHEYAFTEHMAGNRGKFAVQNLHWKLMETGGNPDKFLLFNLDHDPGESRSVASLHPDVTAHLEQQMRRWQKMQWMQQRTPPFVNYPNLDEATKERLQKTGYW